MRVRVGCAKPVALAEEAEVRETLWLMFGLFCATVAAYGIGLMIGAAFR